MIKLESPVAALSVTSYVTIQSRTKEPTIALSCSPARALVDGSWKDDPTRTKQSVAFHSDEGPTELHGLMPESDGVEIVAAFKVVVQVTLSTRNLPTAQVGRVSRALVSLELLRVVEVWTTAEKCAWKAADWGKPASGLVMTEAGKIKAA